MKVFNFKQLKQKSMKMKVKHYPEMDQYKFKERTLYELTNDFLHFNGVEILYCTKTSDKLYGFIIYSENLVRVGTNNDNMDYNAAAWIPFHGEIIINQD